MCTWETSGQRRQIYRCVQQQASAYIPRNTRRIIHGGLRGEIRDYPCTLEQISKRHRKSRYSPVPEAQSGTHATINNETIKFFQPLYDIQDVGTDDAGIYEMVIEGVVIYEKKAGEET